MTALASRRRTRTIAAGLAGVLVLGAAPLLSYYGWDVLRNSKAGTSASTLPEVGFPSTPTAMLAVVDSQQVVTSLAVLVLAPGTGKGGTLVSIPTNTTRAQAFGEPNIAVADSVINGGADGLLSDVESLSSVTLNFNAITKDSDLAALLAPAGSMSVTLPGPVLVPAKAGASTTLFAAGATTMSPAQAASVLAANDPSQTSATRLANVRAVWNGLAGAIGQGLNPPSVGATAPNSFGDFLAHFLAGPVQVYNELNTRPITGNGNPDKRDVGALDRSSVVLVMSGLAPGAMIAPNQGQSYRIENGLTDADLKQAGVMNVTSADLSRDVVGQLLFVESNVVSVSSAVFTLDPHKVPDKTIVFTATPLSDGEAQGLKAFFGDIDFRRPPFTFPLVDVVVVVGRNYLDLVKARPGNTPTVTSTTTAGAAGRTVVGTTGATVLS